MDVETGKVIKGKLVAKKEDLGYITYVFKNQEPTTVFDKYIMCTRFPNWDCEFIEIGDIGYVKFKYVEAGKNTWYNRDTQDFEVYKYTNCIFLNFLREQQKLKDITL